MSRSLALVLALVLGACSAAYKANETSFTRTGGSEFTYVAAADDMSAPAASADGERYRMRFLEEYLRDNRMCAGGYEIVDRQVTVIARGVFGEAQKVLYRGRCKS